MAKVRKTESFGERINRQIRESGGVRVDLPTPEQNKKMNAFIRGQKAAGEGVLDAEELLGVGDQDRE